MIKLRKPLELKCSSSMMKFDDSLEKRIEANYGLISAVIRREELLHLLMEEPEELAPVQITTLVENVSVKNQNEITVKLLNQLMNRILVLGEGNVTYQDNAYITQVLGKLGIHDVSRFISRMRSSMEELRTQRELARLYQNRKDILKKSRSEEYLEENELNEENYLYEKIFQKLHTMEIYQSVNQFNSYQGNNSLISHDEFTMSEQYRSMMNLQFAKEKEEALNENGVSAEYQNFYERKENDSHSITKDSIITEILEAGIYNLIYHMFAVRLKSIEQESRCRWYDTGYEICNTIRNTLERYRYYHEEKVSEKTEAEEKTLEKQRELQRYELQLLKSLTRETGQTETIRDLAEAQVISGTDERKEPADMEILLEETEEETGETKETELPVKEVISQEVTIKEVPGEKAEEAELPAKETSMQEITVEKILQESSVQKNYTADKEKTMQEALRILQRTENENVVENRNNNAEMAEQILEHYRERENTETQYIESGEIQKNNFVTEKREVEHKIPEHYSEKKNAETEYRKKDNLVTEKTEKTERTEIQREETKSITEMNTGTNTEQKDWEEQKEIQREITGEVIQDLKDLVQVQRENRNIKSGSTTGEAVQVLMENREEMHEILEHYNEKPAFRQWNEVTKHQVSEILKELTAEIKEEEGYKTVIPVSDISQSYQIHKKTEFIYPQSRNETEEEGQRIPETVIRNQTNISETNYYRKNIEAGKVQETNTYQAGERETERKDIKVIHEMIQTNVQKEVNHIADQVYKKLERKLQNERKRRGL